MVQVRSGGTFGACSLCETVSCIVCRDPIEAHLGRSDATIRRCKPLLDPDAVAAREVSMAMNGACKRCPSCMTGIERRDGCNTMLCGNPSCKWYFCWLCGKMLVKATKSGASQIAHEHFRNNDTCVLYNGQGTYTGFEPEAEDESDLEEEHEDEDDDDDDEHEDEHDSGSDSDVGE